MRVAKTSETHPLRIDSLPVTGGLGLIGLTFCPGKKHHGSFSRQWDRDLGADLRVIKEFGATALVTLMEPDELAAVNVPISLIAPEADAQGLEWHLLPIRDVSVPNELFEDLWTYTGARLRNLLRCGKSIVIHCLGGLGRTGTVAARLLVEFGEAPKSAIQRVRGARPGSIETPAQEEYVKSCQEMIANLASLPVAEKMLACLLGGALGDAFGYAVEFDSIDSIRQRFGAAGIAQPVYQNGKLIVSDDTQMTLFTLEGMLAGVEGGNGSTDTCLSAIRAAYLDWLTTQSSRHPSDHSRGFLVKQPEMYALRAPGNTCLSALGAGAMGTIASPLNNSKGCGGVMRVAPIGFFCCYLTAQDAFCLGAEAAALTHGHPSGYLSAGLMATIVRSLLMGADLKSAVEESCAVLNEYEEREETLRVVRRALLVAGRKTDHVAAVEELGGGWVGEEALAIGLYAALSADTFVEAVRMAANHSGDSDSTASIAGQLWGAAAGIGNMPHAWIAKLDILQPLLHLTRRFMLNGMPPHSTEKLGK